MATLELQQFLQQSRNFVRDIEEKLPNAVTAAAIEAASEIDRRITESGQNSSGAQLGDYTDGVYKQKRQKRGLTTAYVNLQFTGDMWRDVGVIDTKTQGNITTATIGARFKDADDKLFFNSVRYNDGILELNQQEAANAAEVIDDAMQEIINANFE
jgi:hypothetical protein